MKEDLFIKHNRTNTQNTQKTIMNQEEKER